MPKTSCCKKQVNAWLATAAAAEPALTFVLSFAEPGSDFAGAVRYEHGELVLEEVLNVDDVLGPEEQWF